MKKIMIACPGLRDPITAPRASQRTADAKRDREVTLRWVEAYAEALTKVPQLPEPGAPFGDDQARLGAVLTALHQLENHPENRWLPDEAWLIYFPSEDITPRVIATAKILESRGVIVKLLDVVDADAHEWSVGIHMQRRIREVAFDAADYRIIVGPGTPQMSLGLLLLQNGALPAARVFQVLNPEDVRDLQIMLTRAPYLRELKFDGVSLPRLSIDGQAPQEIQELRRQLDEVHTELKLLQARERADAVPAGGELPASYQRWVEMEAEVVQRLVAEVREEAKAAGRKPTQEDLAAKMGMTRPGAKKVLDRLGIDW